MLQGRARPTRVVDAVDEGVPVHLTEVADLGIVAVQDEQGVGKALHRDAPARCEQLELAVAVELVTGQVPEQERLRAHAARNFGERAFVDLEQAERRPAGGEEGGRNPGDEVRAGAVVGDGHPRPQDLRDHRRGRRLAVGGRDEHRPLGQPAGEPVDRAGIELPEQLAGQRRAAATAGEA